MTDVDVRARFLALSANLQTAQNAIANVMNVSDEEQVLEAIGDLVKNVGLAQLKVIDLLKLPPDTLVPVRRKESWSLRDVTKDER